jgi:hypothetical protein
MSAPSDSLQSVFDRAFAGIGQVRKPSRRNSHRGRSGTITSVSTGIAKVSGLPGVGFEELVNFPAMFSASRSTSTRTKSASFCSGDYWHLHAGDEVERTGRVMDVAVGDGCWDALSIRSVAHSMAMGRWPPPSVCPSNAPPRRSWTARRSRAAADRPQGHRCVDSRRSRPARVDPR